MGVSLERSPLYLQTCTAVSPFADNDKPPDLGEDRLIECFRASDESHTGLRVPCGFRPEDLEYLADFVELSAWIVLLESWSS